MVARLMQCVTSDHRQAAMPPQECIAVASKPQGPLSWLTLISACLPQTTPSAPH